VPEGVWHMQCMSCGMRFVQGDEDAKLMHGILHFWCPRCGETIEILGRLS
jgi:predicted RNA-binding Zn-ribbon protein involved in translation (DUF1610 family)